ncbi:MAG: histidine kinase [Clostridia bacterium BRH_c25]|nr:MAG: histidine kinase [Clostridia bacterium BRH_c25]
MDYKAKILSVDDSSIIRKIVRNSVEVLNYSLLEASSGEEALSILVKEHASIKLILLDWNMPGMNGLELLKIIKKNILYKNIPVMMVTTEGEKGNIVKAVQAGVVNYLLKPFTSEELTKKVMQCIGRV